MTVVLALFVGALTLRFVRVGAASLVATPGLTRPNYRGHLVPISGGILVVVAVLVVEAGRAVFGSLGVGDHTGLTLARSEMLFAVFGFGFLGVVDDLVGQGEDRGFRGHLRAFAAGRITTGFVKLFAGAAVAVVLVAAPGFKSGRTLIVDALLIAFAANLANLLDRAPGRVIKAGLLVYVPLAFVLGDSAIGIALAPVMGAFIGLLGDDLREHLMLGDCGANIIGATLGLGVVLGRGEATRVTIVILLGVLNIAAEFFSFTAVIDRVGVLRAFDRLGTRPERRQLFD